MKTGHRHPSVAPPCVFLALAELWEHHILKGRRTKTGICKGNCRPSPCWETVKCTHDKPRKPLHAVVTCSMEAVISQGQGYSHANMVTPMLTTSTCP